MKIAIYDGVQRDRETAALLISDYYREKGLQADIIQYGKIDDFIEVFRRRCFAAVFIGLNSMRDVDCAWVIRNRDENCPLVIMSRCSDYSLEGYRLKAADYLIKPLDMVRITETLNRLNS